MPDAAAAAESFRGQACVRLSLGEHDSVLVALHGAQVLSWVGAGAERLFLSPRAIFDGRSAIRGGVPVCLPQFNMRGPLPKHGFARNLPWRVDGARAAAAGERVLTLALCDDAATRALWPQSFRFLLSLGLAPGRLRMQLDLYNTGREDWTFTGALHTYLRVRSIAAVELRGLEGQPCWDALSDQRAPQAGTVRFDGPFDRVYGAAAQPLLLNDGSERLRIAQSASFADTVVWNPGQAGCAALADMAADSWQQMLCVEAANVERPVLLPAGGHWTGWQELAVA